MTMHDERWTLGIAENGDVRLRDLKTGETHCFGSRHALIDAIGRLADWRHANDQKSHYGVACEAHGPHPHKGGMTCLDCPECRPPHNADYAPSERPDWWTPEYEAAALEGLAENPAVRHTLEHPGSDRWTGGDRKDEA